MVCALLLCRMYFFAILKLAGVLVMEDVAPCQLGEWKS